MLLGQTVLISIALFGSYSLSRPDGAITSVNSPSELPPRAGRRPSYNPEGPKTQSQALSLPYEHSLEGLTISLGTLIADCIYQSIFNPSCHWLLTIFINIEANALKYSSVLGDSEIDDSRPV